MARWDLPPRSLVEWGGGLRMAETVTEIGEHVVRARGANAIPMGD